MYFTTRRIYVTTSFVGFHRFPDAGKLFPGREYLEQRHRHLFGVKAAISTTHDDRELEYHDLKDRLDHEIQELQSADWASHTGSCETMARSLLDWLMRVHPGRKYYSVEVNEDGENGSVLEVFTTLDLVDDSHEEASTA